MESSQLLTPVWTFSLLWYVVVDEISEETIAESGWPAFLCVFNSSWLFCTQNYISMKALWVFLKYWLYIFKFENCNNITTFCTAVSIKIMDISCFSVSLWGSCENSDYSRKKCHSQLPHEPSEMFGSTFDHIAKNYIRWYYHSSHQSNEKPPHQGVDKSFKFTFS